MIKLKQRLDDDEQHLARIQLTPGTELYGYCGGIFGRDSYGTKTVLSTTSNSILVEEFNGLKLEVVVEDWIQLIEDSNSYLDD